MKYWNAKQWGAFASAILIASLLVLPHARGELVLDQPSPNIEVIGSDPSAALPAPETDRNALRQSVQMSEPLTMQAPQAQAQVQQIQVQPDPEPKLTQSELLRRKRMRQELQNEDALQTRLEELRLKKEQELSSQIMSGGAMNASVQPAQQPAPAQVQVVSDQLQTSQAVPMVAQPVVAGPTASTSALATSTAEAKEIEQEEKNDKTTISIVPRAGVANIVGPSGYDVNSDFSLGAGVVFGFSDHFSIDASYTYSEYGLNIASANPFVNTYQYYFNSGLSPNRKTLNMQQHIGDAGLRVYLLGRKSKVRPYAAGGMGYSQSAVNYDPAIQTYLRQIGAGNSTDYEFNQYLGYLGAGLDVQLSDSISVTAGGKYYSVLSATENSTLNNVAFFSPGVMNPSAYDKAQAGGSLSSEGFYTLQLGVSFTF